MRHSAIEKVALEYAELVNRETALRKELADVVAAKAAKIKQLSSIGSGNGSSALDGTDRTGSGRADAKADSDAKERVFQLLSSDPSREFKNADVIKHLHLKRSTASVYLSELANEKRIRRVSKGRYQGWRHPSPTTKEPKAKEQPKGADDARPARIMATLKDEPLAAFSAQDIAKKLGEPGAANSISGALSRLHRDGKIQKVGHGKYRAVRYNDTNLPNLMGKVRSD